MARDVQVQEFFDPISHTFSYVVSDPVSRCCAVIDPVLEFELSSATTQSLQADQIITYIQSNHLHLVWILETHVHADHLSAAQYLKQILGGKVAISENIAQVQATFAKIYDLDIKSLNHKQPFDHLFKDGEAFSIGHLSAYSLATPGHTPACLSYVIEDCIFVGDTLFMPDYGSARCDFPQGDAAQLFDSVQKIYQLPETMRMFLCHDYLPEKRENYQFQTDIDTQKRQNIHIHQHTTKADFVRLRRARDAKLSMPQLMLAAIQINIQAGHFPQAAENGIAYLKIPLNYFK